MRVTQHWKLLPPIVPQRVKSGKKMMTVNATRVYAENFCRN